MLVRGSDGSRCPVTRRSRLSAEPTAAVKTRAIESSYRQGAALLKPLYARLAMQKHISKQLSNAESQSKKLSINAAE